MNIPPVIGAVGATFGILGTGFGLFKQFVTAKSEAEVNDENARKVAIDAANEVVKTVTSQFSRQAKVIEQLEKRVDIVEERNGKLEKEVKHYKDDCEILIRIVKENNVKIRESDAIRLGLADTA